MTIPALAIAMPGTYDPRDELPHVLPLSPWLEIDEGEQVASFTLTIGAEGTALGLELMTGGGRDAALVEDDRSILIWPTINSAYRSNAAFDAVVELPIEVTFVTNSVPPATRQFTALYNVAQR